MSLAFFITLTALFCAGIFVSPVRAIVLWALCSLAAPGFFKKGPRGFFGQKLSADWRLLVEALGLLWATLIWTLERPVLRVWRRILRWVFRGYRPRFALRLLLLESKARGLELSLFFVKLVFQNSDARFQISDKLIRFFGFYFDFEKAAGEEDGLPVGSARLGVQSRDEGDEVGGHGRDSSGSGTNFQEATSGTLVSAGGTPALPFRAAGNAHLAASFGVVFHNTAARIFFVHGESWEGNARRAVHGGEPSAVSFFDVLRTLSTAGLAGLVAVRSYFGQWSRVSGPWFCGGAL